MAKALFQVILHLIQMAWHFGKPSKINDLIWAELMAQVPAA